VTIVDSHCHAGHGDGLTGPWDTHAPLSRYLRRADRAGIDRIVLLAAFHSDYRTANREVARIVAGDPGRFFGYAFVNPVRDRGRVAAMVDEAVNNYGFCGIKVHRHDGRLSREVCEVARRWQIPIMYDVMGQVAGVTLFAQQYPDVNFVIPHLGSFADDWSAQSLFLDGPLCRFGNVFTDTSGVRRFDLLVEAVRRAGPAKVLFGSDGPWLHPGLELGKVRLLGLPAAAERLVLGENFLRLTGTSVQPTLGQQPWLAPASA
jgi:predicted TIM-barrel fold metal-dependent hydrolase